MNAIRRSLVFLIPFLFVTSADTPIIAGSDSSIRVAVLIDAAGFDISIKGRYKVLDLKSSALLGEGARLREAHALPLDLGIKVGERVYASNTIKIRPERRRSLYLNKKRFRGSLNILRTKNGRLTVVNELDIEKYLYGVMHNEVSHWWPLETLKAQAIAARTFALYQKQVSVNKDYDLKSDVSSQVYTGARRERLKTRMAVNRTKGVVLTYKGRIFPSFYHANCGGHTERASELWDIDLEPLEGVKCDFCKDTKHYRWKRDIALAKLKTNLARSGYDVGSVEDIIAGNINGSGRAREVEVKTNSKTITMPAKDFRRIVGVDIIRSLKFTASVNGDRAYFEGFGWGHGVGLCQWGAYVMGRYDYTAEEILKFYYPGAEIQR